VIDGSKIVHLLTHLRKDWRRRFRRRPHRRHFHLALGFFYWTPSYVLALASLSAYAKARVPGLRVTLVPIQAESSPSDFVCEVLDLDPDLLGISVASPVWPRLVPYLTKLGRQFPELPIVIGGYQAILSPAETISHPAVRYVCSGEGEQPLVDLILRFQTGDEAAVSGLWEKTASGEIRTSGPVLADLSKLPFPDYSLYADRQDLRYWGPHGIESSRLLTVPVLTGRGCPHRCTYCNNTSLLNIYKRTGKYLRKYRVESVIEGLVNLKHRYGVEYFQFADEMFLSDMVYARQCLRAYQKDVCLPFSIFSHVERMTPEFCEFAAGAGCHSMWFGVESGSESYRRRYLNRTMSNEEILRAAQNARRAGIKLMIFNMIGMPFESKGDMLRTIELTRQIDPERAVFGQYVPLPATPLYELARESGLLLPTEEGRQMWELGHLNLREHPLGATRAELSEITQEIWRYHAENNRFDS